MCECGDEDLVRGMCDTCYRRARRAGLGLILPRVSDDERERIRELLADGHSLHETSRRTGRGVTTVFRCRLA